MVDPHTGDIYLTEDAAGPNGLLYRWLAPQDFRAGRGALRAPPATGRPRRDALHRRRGEHVDDLSLARTTGTRYTVEWVDVPDRDAREEPTRRQLGDGDVTRGRKLEGAWWRGAGAYVVSSFAGVDESPEAARRAGLVPRPARSTLTLGWSSACAGAAGH